MSRVELIIQYTDGNTTKTRAIVNKWKFQDAMMGEQFITFTVTSEKPIDWAIGDYCVFRGETFTLNNIPSVVQKARTGERQDAYTYENVKLESRQEELTRVIMLDITPTTGEYVPALGTNYTGSSKFQLFCGETSAIVGGVVKTFTPVCALAAKMQANLDRAFGVSTWRIYVDTETTYENPSGRTILVTHTDDKVMSFDNTTVAQALSEVHNTFDLNYCVKGRNIYIGYTLHNLTSDEPTATFDFGYGKGYPTPLDSGKALFQIKRIANSQQKIVTRLRALGSTKNLPYRYYNNKYGLSQSLFPTNLQLPDTFEEPSVKESHNAERDRIYGISPTTNLPYIRHVKGETNDAYIDKNDNAESCVDGVREDCARWDGSNSDLPEIYPTIEEATYGELRGSLVPDQDGNTGSGSFPGYDSNERVDELLAIGYMSGGMMVDDANQGGGILPESSTTGTGIPRTAVIGLTSLNYNSVNYGDFTPNSSSHYSTFLLGPEMTLFTVNDVFPGRYIMTPTGASYDSVRYGFNISSQRDGISADVGFLVVVKQKSKETSNINVIATYISDFTHISRGETKEVSLPEIPDAKEGSSARVEDITVTETSDIIVSFAPIIRNVVVPSGFTDNFAFVYQVGKSRIDVSNPYEPEYTWKSLDEYGGVEDIFHVFIKDMGFDITACFTGDTPLVAMKSGHCVGREFEIGENVEKVIYRGKKGYMLTLHRATDSSLNTYYPSSVDPIAPGDNFVLLNINMPDAYIKMAEFRLLRAATDYLADNCETQFTYQPYLDDIYLQRNYDKMVAAGTPQLSIFWRLYAGLKFTFRGIPSHEDDPLPLAELTIEQVSISMGEGLTPKVEITLNDDVQQTTLQKLTISVDRIYNTLNGANGGRSSSESYAMLISLLNSEGGKRFLSKVNPDVAHGLIDFLAGLTTGNFHHGSTGASIDARGNAELESALIRRQIISDNFYKGQLGGSGWGIYKDSNGHSTMELDNLIVRMKAVFAELEIRKLSYIGGDYIFSSAGSMICKVEYLDSDGNVVAHTKLHALVDGDGNLITQGDNPVVWNEDVEIDPEDIAKFRCYVYADDGSTRTMNWWEVGDQARCQSFNIKEGVHKNATNKFYWRLVVGTGTAELEDGNVYNYVDLSNTNYAGKAQDEANEKHWRVMHPEQGDVDKEGQQLTWVDAMGYPAPGDAIVQLGNKTNVQRQNAIEIVVEGDNAPAIIEYKGINDYRLSTHRRTVLSPNGDEYYAKSYTLVTANEAIPIPRDRGEWDSTKQYHYYDRVSWNGSLWLCIIEDGTHEEDGVEVQNYTTTEPSDNNDDWLKQVSGGSQGTPGQSTPLMVCLPNPLNIEADNGGLAVSNWSEEIRVRVYYNGIQQTPLTVSATIDNTSLTTRIDGNVGVVTISGTQGSLVPNAAVNVTATFANPSGGASITSYGTFTISPSKNGTNGSNGKTLGQVVISPSPYYIEADDSGNPYRNADDNIDVMVLNPDTGLGLPINGVTFNGYSSWSNYGDRFRLWLDEYYDDSNGYHASIGIYWAQSLQVVDEKVRIQISYENGAQEQLYANAVIAVQPNRAGAAGTSPLSIQCTPNVLYIPVDNSSDLTTREVNETVNVKLFDGSQIGTISEIRSVEDASGNDYLSLSYGMNQDGTAYVRVHIDNDTTFDGDSWVAITLVDSSGNEVSGGFAAVRNINGSNGTNGRGISRIETTYGISDSYDDVPQSWSQTQPLVGERQMLWTRMIIYYTDGTFSDPIYTIAYQGGDGDNGTSVAIKGSAVGHSIDVSGITSTGIWLLDEFGTDHRSYVLNVTSFSDSTMDYTASIPENGDGYIVESTGHLWVATEGAWVDAGRIKGDDGAPAYLHYAWANSEDGSLNFTTNKAVGSEYHYIGICTDSIEADPGSDERPVENAWTLYDWNPIGEGNKGTTILGEALDYVNDQKMSIGGADFSTRNRTKPYLLDLNNYAFNEDSGEFYRSDGNGVGHKLVYFWTSRSGGTTINHVSFADPEEADAWLIDGLLYSSIDQRWMNLGQYTGDSAYVHYAWANSSDGYKDFTTSKLPTQEFDYVGFLTDNIEEDSQVYTDYEWTRIRGNDGVGIDTANTKVAYAIDQNGVDPPENKYFKESIVKACQERGFNALPDMWYLWTRTIIFYTDGNSTTSYTVAYQGKEGSDGRSVNLLGTIPTYDPDLLELTQERMDDDDPLNDFQIGDGYIVEEDGCLYIWNGTGWVNVGQFRGENGLTTYMHIAWGNELIFQNGKLVGVRDFSVSKEEGVDYVYIGVCTDFEEKDPDIPAHNPERPVVDAWKLYTWNMVKGAEGSVGKSVKGEIVAHIQSINSSIKENGWYAIDNPSGYGLNNPTPCLRRRYNNQWGNALGGDIVYPDEGDCYVSNEDGHIYSYIEARWKDIGRWRGEGTYLHLAWANSSDGSDGFTTEKGAADDYAYMGICYDNDVNDPGSPQRPVDNAWTLYDWQRVRGISPAEIILNSDYAVADTDENGRITNLNMVSGLPTSVRFFADGVNVKLSSWSSATITYIFKDIPSVTYNIGSKNPTFRTEAGVKVTGRTWSSTSDSVALTWGYAQDNGVDPILNLRQIKFTVSASHSDISYTAEKTIPFILNMKGESSKFRVQYSADKGVSDPWHYGYNDGTNHIGSEPDKWMRISDDGGATWDTPIKIVANEMNVRGEAYFHNATAPSKPSPWDDSHVGLVDTIGTKKSVVVKWTGSTRTDTEATIGDCYILRDETSDANGHLFIATENGWTDIGQVAGANGKDAIVATTDPAQLIVTQEEAGIAPPSPTTRVIVVEGDNVVPISNFTIGEGYVPDTDAYNCNATIDNTTKTVSVQIRTTGSTITVDGISYPTYYSNGWVKIPVKYKSYSAKLVFNWYANLLGTWKQTIKGDVNTMLANRVRYVEDDNGDIVLLSNDGKFILSSKELSALLTEYHDDVFITEASLNMTAYELGTKVRNNEGNIAQLRVTANNISTSVTSLRNQYSDISQTAQEIVSTVQSLPIGAANLFNFSECKFTGSGLGKAIPYIQGYGFECNTNYTRLANLGTNGIGGDFVVTCEMRMGGDSPSTTRVHVDICDKLSKEGEFRNITTSWIPQVFTFEDLDSPHFAGSYNGFMDFEGIISDINRLQIRNLKIERGQVPTAFCISDKDANAFNSNDILTFTENPLLTVESSRYKGYKVYKLSAANYPSTEANMFYASKSNGYLGVGKVFTLSFYAKSSVNGTVFGNYFYGNLDTQNRNNPVDGTIGGDHSSIANGGMTALNRFDGGTFIKLTTAWKRYTIHWFNQNQGDRNIEFGRLNADWSPAADVYVTGIEFREGYWTDEQMNSQSMIRQTANEIEMRVNDTGINIEDGSITLNADKTTIVGDLSLRDTNQGLVLYDGGNTERVTVKPETLGNLDDYQFGTRIITAADAIVVNGVVSFEAIVLGQATAGGTFQISQLRLTKNNDFTLSMSMSYSYSIKNNGTTLVTKTGSLSSSGSYWYLDVSSGNISNTGNLTLTLTLTNVSASYASFRAHVIGNITGVGLNKIGKDGAMFANDRTHYNWFGVDQTQFQQGATTLRISENGIFRNGMDIGSYTKVSVVSTSGSNVEPVATNVYNWHADLSMGIILINTNATFNIYLPYCYNCVGKIYYVKRLAGTVNVFMDGSGSGGRFLVPSDSDAAVANISLGSRATMFVSAGGYWLEFDCS